MSYKSFLKHLLGELPLTAELYWSLRQSGKPLSANFSLKKVEKHLPVWVAQAGTGLGSARSSTGGRHILVFATLRYWVEHACLLGLGLAGMGHHVSFGFLPYGSWKKAVGRFDLRRQNAYALDILRRANPSLEVVSFLNGKKGPALPAELAQAIGENAWRDTQYSLQLEDVDPHSDLYRLRQERDTEAARAALAWLQENRPQVVVIPNGSILEFGAVYQTARYVAQHSFPLRIVTYEFGEQRQRIWLAQDGEVMRQETDHLWQARKDCPLTDEQVDQVRALFFARQRASLWENFARRWQGVPSAGGEQVRATLGLDEAGDHSRPVVLLATNVIGDSLTLGRQVFSASMSEWLERTIRYFAGRQDVQFIVRIHPGELITKGPSVADLARRVLGEFKADEAGHIHLVLADAQVNTYDLVEIADLGLVYTTTVGMEMAMSGAPVIVAGHTHYRGKGFTLDPQGWEAYFRMLDDVLSAPDQYRLSREQVEAAWNYAYRFFFEYPHPFPWHILQFWKDQEEWPLSRVLGEEGQAVFGETFRYLAGETIRYA